MTVTINLPGSGPPKRDIIDMAYEECGRAIYDTTPEEIATALRRLDAMMAEWKGHRGIDLGYIQPDYGVGTPTDPSGIPFETLETVALYLALRIAPTMGKTLSAETKAAMARSLMTLQSVYAVIPSAIMPNGTPAGSGNRWYSPFTYNKDAVAE